MADHHANNSLRLRLRPPLTSNVGPLIMRNFVSLLFISSVALHGCALTRVSGSAHKEEVERLNLIELNHADAIAKLTASGFTCYNERLSSVVSGRKIEIATCYKKSAELICPQIRKAIIEVDVNSKKVSSVRTHMVDKGCF